MGLVGKSSWAYGLAFISLAQGDKTKLECAEQALWNQRLLLIYLCVAPMQSGGASVVTQGESEHMNLAKVFESRSDTHANSIELSANRTAQ